MTHDEAIAKGAALTGYEVHVIESSDAALRGQRLLLTTLGLAFGRAPHCRDQEHTRVCICIESGKVSRLAATLDWVPGEGVVLTDQHNDNGVWVDGAKIK